MKRYANQEGMALIMLIGVLAVVATLALTLVMVTANMQGSTKDVTTRSKAFNVAEAGLDLGMYSLSSAWPTNPPAAGSQVTLATDPRTLFTEEQFPTSPGNSFVTVTMSPGSDADHLLLQSQANVGGKSVRLETQIVRANVGYAMLKPGAALYSGSGFSTNGNLSVTSPQINGLPTGGVYINGSWTASGNSHPDFSTVAVYATGSIDVPGGQFGSVLEQNAPAATVGSFSDYISPEDITSLTQTAQNAAQSSPTGVVTYSGNKTVNNGTAIAVHVTGNLTVSGNYTVSSSLWVDGSLSIAAGGRLNAVAVHVGGNLTGVNNAAAILGPTWVGGNVDLSCNNDCQLKLLVAGGSVGVTGGNADLGW